MPTYTVLYLKAAPEVAFHFNCSTGTCIASNGCGKYGIYMGCNAYSTIYCKTTVNHGSAYRPVQGGGAYALVLHTRAAASTLFAGLSTWGPSAPPASRSRGQVGGINCCAKPTFSQGSGEPAQFGIWLIELEPLYARTEQEC